MSKQEQQRRWYLEGLNMTEKQVREGDYTSEQRFFMLQGVKAK